MNIKKFAFGKPDNGRDEVYIVRKGKKYGLIAAPIRAGNLPKVLSADRLQALGGSFITPPRWDEIRVNVCFDPGDDPACEVHEPNDITCNYYVLSDGRWGILDEAGRMIRELAYEEIRIVNHHEDPELLDDCLRYGFDYLDVGAISGRVLVCADGKWGMLRGRGDVVLPPVYDSIDIASCYRASRNVYVVGKDGSYGVVDPYGKVYIPIEYPSLHNEGLDYMWDASVFRIESSVGTGYVRLGDGKCLVAPEWERIDTDRLYLAPDGEPWGYIFTVWKNGCCGLILDDKGMIIPPVWDEIAVHRLPLQDPLSYGVRRGKRWGCCDESGHLICDAVWDEVGMCLDGIACVKKGGKWGAIGADGRLCVPTEWDEIDGFGVGAAKDAAAARTNASALLGSFRNGETGLPGNLSWAKRNGLWGIIDTEGHVIAAPVGKTRESVLEANGKTSSICDNADRFAGSDDEG